MTGREGADARTSGQIYLAVVELMVVYGSETWMTTQHIGRFWGRFHRSLARRLMGGKPWQGRDGVWTYPPLKDAIAEASLQEVENYVSLLLNKVAQFITTRLIMDLCLAAERIPGPWVSRQWWEQDRVDVEGMRTADQEAERREGEEETDRTVMSTGE